MVVILDLMIIRLVKNDEDYFVFVVIFVNGLFIVFYFFLKLFGGDWLDNKNYVI